MIRAAIVVLVGLTLVGALVQLTCIASERVATPSTMPSHADPVAPDLPVAPEVDDAAGVGGPVLTY